MRPRPLSRKGFLAKGAQLMGGAVAARSILGRIRLDGLPRPRAGGAASSATANSEPGLDKLRAACESNDIDELIALLHAKVEWRGTNPSLPWQRAPA